MLVSQAVPGALGLVLRKMLYPRLLGACGRNVVFGQNVVLRHPGKIRIGDNVVIDDNCLLDAKGDTNAGITIGSGVFVGRNTILSCKNGDIELGDRANIGFNCEVFSASRVTRRRRRAAGRLLLRDRRRSRLRRPVDSPCWRRRAGRRASPSVTASGWAPAPRSSTASPSAAMRSSGRARWSATMCPTTPSRSAARPGSSAREPGAPGADGVA